MAKREYHGTIDERDPLGYCSERGEWTADATDDVFTVNERRAHWGAQAVYAAGTSTNVWNVEDAETTITDVMAYILHFANRCGIGAEWITSRALDSYYGDYEDGLYVEATNQPHDCLGDVL